MPRKTRGMLTPKQLATLLRSEKLEPSRAVRGRRTPPTVGGEEDAYAGLRVSTKLGGLRDRVVSEQHGSIQRFSHDQPVEVQRRGFRIIDRYDAALPEALEQRRLGVERSPRTALVQGPRQIGEATDF